MNKQEKLIKQISELDINTITENDIINIICEYGLVHDPGCDYGEWNKYAMSRRDIPGIYQTPMQIAQCILELLKYDINTYLEIGIFQGGSYLLMTNFLKLKNPNIKCIGVDISDQYMSPEVYPYIEGYTIGTSEDFIGQDFDLVFIDGDHSYTGIERDWLNVGQFSKITMFHDIVEPSCPGVKQFWDKLRVGKNYKEYCYQTKSKYVQGIGLLFND